MSPSKKRTKKSSQKKKIVIEYETDDEYDEQMREINSKCIAVKKTGKNKGTRCTNNKKPGHEYCGVHMKKEAVVGAINFRCIALTKKGEQCKKKAIFHDNTYCYTHKDQYVEPPVVPADPMSKDKRHFKQHSLYTEKQSIKMNRVCFILVSRN